MSKLSRYELLNDELKEKVDQKVTLLFHLCVEEHALRSKLIELSRDQMSFQEVLKGESQ